MNSFLLPAIVSILIMQPPSQIRLAEQKSTTCGIFEEKGNRIIPLLPSNLQRRLTRVVPRIDICSIADEQSRYMNIACLRSKV
jgi:hypothetical protein